MGHIPSSSVKAKRTEAKFELYSLYIVGETGFCSLSLVKKIDCLKEKEKKMLRETEQDPHFLHDIIHSIHDQCEIIQCTQKQEYDGFLSQQSRTLGLVKCWN